MKTFLLPLSLFIAAAQATQLVLGAIALIQFTIEILEGRAVVATIDVSVDAALTGAADSQTATIQGTILTVGTTVNRVDEGSMEFEGQASLSGFGRVATRGRGFVQGTFTYKQPYPLGVSKDRRALGDPHVSFSFGVRTNAIRSGGTTSISFNSPYISNPRIANPGGVGTSVRIQRQPTTRIMELS